MSQSIPDYSSKAPVLVTGATGYLAGWIVKRLLEEGKTVHAAVRDPNNSQKIAHLDKMAADLPGEIKYFKADLLDEGSFDAAMAGCDVVMHTASPFTSDVKDPQKDLVDPAVKGTRNVLQSANRTDSVKRVVVTSSCAAIYGDAVDVAKSSGSKLTEKDWNTTSRLDHQAYSFSKVEAEKAAWEMEKAQDRWQLVTINPSFIIGPGTAETQTSESFNLVKQAGDGTFKMGVPKMEIGMVDVRDVAEAHLRAGFIDEAAGRHIVSKETRDFLYICQVLRDKFGEHYPFAKGYLPKWLVWLIGPMANKALTREMVAKNVDHPWAADNSKSKEALGLTYRPLEPALEDMFQQLLNNGAVARK
ncbi:NAD-dependent epimerase/dehydratase family protein [Maritalea mediterranea]|uniref:NAD-dependent epimerase/dehydratase family protein n=1 Tax=Maritalea mediterranea TaxID=2909667 RepID=A0ABS9EA85_9HYPH|nr:NAD-dependent epimerase/dehydratase family protein [Maritalea mediterranea]MCF4099673.1 NAD-dependent epimerase/dehydratase family protein [Maritalea mediterranea]